MADLRSTDPIPAYSDAPEVVSGPVGSDVAPSTLFNDPNSTEKIPAGEHQSPKPESYYNTPVLNDAQLEHNNANINPTASIVPWWRKKRVWIIAVILLLVIIGLAAGLAVGLSKKSDSNNDSGSDSATGDEDDTDRSDIREDLCGGNLCPQILATASFDDHMYIFARTSDDRINYKRSENGSYWGRSWNELGEDEGKLISQPAAVSWDPDEGGPRLDVFAVSSSSNKLLGRHFQDDKWSEWEALGRGAGSQPIACRTKINRTDVFVTEVESHDIWHNTWMSTQEWNATGNGALRDAGDTGPAVSAPAVVCRDSHVIHDVFWYDQDADKVWHRPFDQDVPAWGGETDFDGKFIGDPTLFAFDDEPERMDFFGVQDNRELYHISWDAGDFSVLERLGGSFSSVPSVVSPSDGIYDVVGLGTDGVLKHRRYDGTGWSKDWEDLGLKAQSAPLVVSYNDRVVLFAINGDGEMITASFRGGRNETWKSLINVENIGGDLSLAFMTVG